MFPERQEQPSTVARCGARKFSAGWTAAPEQTFFEALMDPSLHTKLAAAQGATPPLLPEHG